VRLRRSGWPAQNAGSGEFALARNGGSQGRHEAHISAGGVEKDVNLIETEDANDAVDAAYDTRYGRRYPTIVPSIVAPNTRAATLKLVPRQEETS
jgi:hypothetical protein